MKRIALFSALAVFAFGCSKAAEESDGGSKTGEAPAPATAGGYADVQALLTAKCVGCHGENGKEGIDLRTYESVMKGGEHGAIVTAGDPAASLIVKAVRGAEGVDKMPKMGAPLTEDEIGKIEAWIKAGAKN